MKIWYVFMAFPAPSETFAGVEVRAVHEQGDEISVHALRMPHRAAGRLIREWGLEAIPISHGSWRKVLGGCLSGLVHLPVLADLVGWIVARTWSKPMELCKSLALTPLVLCLFRDIQRERPEVVHLFWGHYPALLGYLVHKYCPDVVLSLFLGAYDLRQGFACSVEVARSADVVWTHTRFNVGDLVRSGIPADKIRLNYRGIKIAGRPEDAQAKLPLRMISAGRLLKSKGMDDVLQVFSKVRQHHPQATLAILGDGPEMAALKSLAADLGVAAAVTFHGEVPHARVFAEMRQAEIFLFMSKIERLPNVVKEAMFCRCLCVVTETPGIRELVRDTENGLVVADDVDAVVERVLAMLDDPARCRVLAEQGRRTVLEQFDVDRNVLQYLTVWSELNRQEPAGSMARAVGQL